jgi:hypothetical protein
MAIQIGGTTVINDTGGIVFPDAGGSGFSVDTNTLSDFEEGSWLPLLATAATGSTAQDGTFSRRGKYVRIGNTVTVWCTNTLVEFTVGSENSQIYMQGLPFEPTSVTSPNDLYFGSALITYLGARDAQPVPYILDNQASVRFIFPNTTFGDNMLFSDIVDGSTTFWFTITYKTSV